MDKLYQAGVLVNHEAKLAPRAAEWLHQKPGHMNKKLTN